MLSVFLTFFLIRCSDDSLNQNPTFQTDMGNLKVSLTDAPADFDAVNITFSEVSAHIELSLVRSQVRSQEL